uniref:Uncharacterized protein n=1 Tax=Arundo donax TaxID=35708 RepID=A0A0A9EQA5_ARUDO
MLFQMLIYVGNRCIMLCISFRGEFVQAFCIL